jgi:hypothetical protein
VRERLTTLVCAFGALIAFVTLFLGGGGGARQELSPPTSLEAGDNGLLAARRWLARERVPTLSWRERYEALDQRRDLPPSGNLLMVSLPAATPFRPQELRALDRWIRAGNTLLVLAAIADRPDWAFGRSLQTDLVDLTGISYETVRLAAAPAGAHADDKSRDFAERVTDATAGRLPEPEAATLVPNRAHAYLEGVRQAVAWSDYPSRPFAGEAQTVTVPPFGFLLCLARQRETGEGVLWVRPRGAGSVILSGFGSLFSNRALGQADNARLLANIVAASRGAGGAVLFDDEHQGVSDAYDPARFYSDPRLYATLAVLAALWFTWVLGGTRLRVPELRAAAPREAELVSATGGFLARALTPAAAAQRLLEHFFRRVRQRARRSPEAQGPPWELLDQHPRVSRAELAQLRAWYAAAWSEERVPLARLYNLLLRIERRLAR